MGIGGCKMLSCSCDINFDSWYYMPPDFHFKTLIHKRRKRCCSCENLIEINALCVEFDRYRPPISDIEERICGDEVGLASWFMCEPCGEIYYNLNDIRYCMYLGDDMRDNLKNYWEITGFVRKKEAIKCY